MRLKKNRKEKSKRTERIRSEPKHHLEQFKKWAEGVIAENSTEGQAPHADLTFEKGIIGRNALLHDSRSVFSRKNEKKGGITDAKK